MPENTIELKLSARAKRAMLLNDLIPAAILVMTGIGSLGSEKNVLMTALNLLSGGATLFFGIRKWRSFVSQEEKKVDFYDIVCGIVMMINAAVMYKPWKGFQPAHLYCLAGIFILMKGISVIKIRSFRRLRVDDAGFFIRTRPFIRFAVRWSDITGISFAGEDSFTVMTLQRTRTVSLRNIENRNDVIQALQQRLQIKQIRTEEEKY